MDKATKLVTAWEVTTAQVHDSQVLEEVLQPPEIGGTEVYADLAYRSKAQEESLVVSKHTSHIHEKGARNHPLTEMQKASNKKNSRVRARVEHVFGSMTMSWAGQSGLNSLDFSVHILISRLEVMKI